MNKYGEAAIRAVDLVKSGKQPDPKEAWEIATIELFGKGSPSQQKACPRGTFLGLCEEGLVEDIIEGKYSGSKKNKAYALKAVELLKQDSSLIEKRNALWNKSAGENKVHNNQMDVVTALWVNKKIRVI